MRNTKKTRGSMTPLVCAIAVFAMQAMADRAESADVPAQSGAASEPVYLTFDWHANAKPRSPERLFQVGNAVRSTSRRWVRNGNGTYICSPSGAGQRSRCYTR